MKNKNNRIIFTILIISISFALMVFIKSDPDQFWHFASGKYMYTHHKILTHDIFSWYLAGKYWMSHEWLFEIILYLFYLIFFDKYLIMFGLINIFILLFIIYRTNEKDIYKNKAYSLFWLAFYYIRSLYSR